MCLLCIFHACQQTDSLHMQTSGRALLYELEVLNVLNYFDIRNNVDKEDAKETFRSMEKGKLK